MKKLLLVIFVLLLFCGCQRHSWRETLTDDQVFEFSAMFDRSKTAIVQQRFTAELGDKDMSFIDNKLDAEVKLENGMLFHIESKPGKLRVKFDKTQNTAESYTRMKAASDAIKAIVNHE